MPGTHDARLRLTDAAAKLIVSGGVGAASPAAVADRAGASKMSIYRHFGGKDELIAAALDYREKRHRHWLLGSANRGQLNSILAVFDRVEQAAHADSFTGCPYLNASLELRNIGHPATAVVREHKRRVLDELSGRLRLGGVGHPKSLARVLLMLLDGATAHAVLTGSGAPLREARAAAKQLILHSALFQPTERSDP